MHILMKKTYQFENQAYTASETLQNQNTPNTTKTATKKRPKVIRNIRLNVAVVFLYLLLFSCFWLWLDTCCSAVVLLLLLHGIAPAQ